MCLTTPAFAQEEDSIPLPGDDTGDAEVGPQAGVASLSLELRGYLENTFTAEYRKEQKRETFMNGTRTRLNLSGKPGGHTDFAIGVVAPLYAGTTTIDLVPYLPEETQSEIVPPNPGNNLPGAGDWFAYTLDDDIYIQEAFGTLYLPQVRLRVGRQKFYTGTGYAFNPIDLFNVINPLDPTYEVDGFDAVLAVLEFPRQTEIQVLSRFSDRFNTADHLARLKTHLSGWDLALQYTRYVKERVNWEAINTADGVLALSEGTSIKSFTRQFRWNLVAAEFVGELWQMGFHGEGGYVFIEDMNGVGTIQHARRDHARFLIGMDHTFQSQLYFIVEYLRLGQGRTESSEISLNDRMALFTGEAISTNRDNVFGGLSYPITDLSELSLYGIVACNDPSAIINPWLLVDLYPGVKLSLTAYIPVGDEESQNGNAGVSGFARLKFSY